LSGVDNAWGLRLIGDAPRGLPGAIAVCPGTRQSFLVSDQLAHVVSSGRECRNRSLHAAVSAEVQRLASYGFWYEHSADLPSSDQRAFTVGLNLVHGCNLACSYCNVNKGTYDGTGGVMGACVVDASLDLLFAHSHARDVPAMLVLFGGEPTLNWDMVVRATHRFRERFTRSADDIWIVTNGTLLNAERVRFLGQHRVLVVVSLDGEKGVHDAHRRFADGIRGSFDAVADALRLLEAQNVRYTVRGTWVPGVGNRVEQLSHMRAMAPRAQQVTLALDFFADAEGYGAFVRSLHEEWRLFEQRDYAPPAPATSAVLVDIVLRGDWAPTMQCPAAVSGFCVTPTGAVYPCQTMAAHARGQVGSVLEGGLEPGALLSVQEKLGLQDGPGAACEACVWRAFCGGPCILQRPLDREHPNCRVFGVELAYACRLAALSPLANLQSRYHLGLTTAQDRRALARAAAVRAIAWQRNAHLRPLALCPAPTSTRQVA